MSSGEPCRNCGCCPHCGQRMPGVAGPYVPYTPVIPYIPNVPYIPSTPPIWTEPYYPWQPGDIYVGDPPPGLGSISICGTTTSVQSWN